MSSSGSTAPITHVERRNLFDKAALGCISYLERCEECRTVTFHGNEAVPSHEFLLWEKRNIPLKLPDDMRKLYSMFNAFTLTWTVELGEKLVPIGDMRINKVDQLIKINCDCSIANSNLPFMEMKNLPDLSRCTLVSLDSSCEVGEVVLLYRNISDDLPAQPEVWLLDQAAQLTFICSTFSQYMRLMVLHLGIYGWQLLFTSDGLPENAQIWMDIFCKERLLIDRTFRADIEKELKGRGVQRERATLSRQTPPR
jgi:tubulin polyglutamylase complex subunit 2